MIISTRGAPNAYDKELLRDTSDPLLTMDNVVRVLHIVYVSRDEYETRTSLIRSRPTRLMRNQYRQSGCAAHVR